MSKRVGIYAGTFNPVHAGHVTFALQTMQAAKLDKLYFLPERRPRHKKGVEHFGHRVAMLERALRPHPKLEVLELDDISFSVNRTLPRLESMFPGDRLVFLFGSDVVPFITGWQQIDRLFATSELAVGIRENQNLDKIQSMIESWQVKPLNTHLLMSFAPDVSSHNIREALRGRTSTKGLLASVSTYSNRHWLYVSLA